VKDMMRTFAKLIVIYILIVISGIFVEIRVLKREEAYEILLAMN